MESRHSNLFFINNYASSSNPLNIPEILQLVLSYIEPAKNDLLNCRLVNHTWNHGVVQIVRKKGWSIVIDESNLFKYRALLRKAKISRQRNIGASFKTRIVYSKPYLRLPAEPNTNSKMNQHVLSLDLSLNLNKSVQVQGNNNLIFGVLNLLIQIPQLRVISFTYTTEDQINKEDKDEGMEDEYDDDEGSDDHKINHMDVDLNKILTLVLPNLRNLELDLKFLNSPPIRETIENFLQARQIRALTSLCLYLSNSEDDNQLGSPAAYQLINAAPNLTKLCITGDNILNFVQNLIQTSTATTSSLTELEISIPNEVIFKALNKLPLQNKFGGCKELKIIQEEAISFLPGFSSFLTTNFSVLEHLELQYNKCCGLYIRSGPTLPQVAEFESVVPRLISLGLYSNNNYASHLAELRFNGRQILYSLIAAKSQFPALTTITFDFMALHYLSFGTIKFKSELSNDPNNEDLTQHQLPSLPNVKNFTMLIPNDVTNVRCSPKTSIFITQVLEGLLPGVVHFEINIKDLIDGDADVAAFQIRAVTFSLRHFCSTGKLTSLVIHNYCYDWLKKLYELEPIGCQGLKHLKLTRSLRAQNQSTCKGFITTTTDKSGLTLVLDNSLGLQLLEIDSQLFRYGACTWKRESIRRQLEARKITNPNLRIEFI